MFFHVCLLVVDSLSFVTIFLPIQSDSKQPPTLHLSLLLCTSASACFPDTSPTSEASLRCNPVIPPPSLRLSYPLPYTVFLPPRIHLPTCRPTPGRAQPHRQYWQGGDDTVPSIWHLPGLVPPVLAGRSPKSRFPGVPPAPLGARKANPCPRSSI